MIGRIDIPLASILLLIALTGCSDYQGISPTAYQYAKALYNVTNRKRGEKLDEVNNLITSSKREGTITTQEANWLREIVDDAQRMGVADTGPRNFLQVDEDALAETG